MKATVIPIEIRRSLENSGVIRTTASARLIRDHLELKNNKSTTLLVSQKEL